MLCSQCVGFVLVSTVCEHIIHKDVLHVTLVYVLIFAAATGPGMNLGVVQGELQRGGLVAGSWNLGWAEG